jgi:4-amino-4-deoxy-L-arabinose transferase-like glycosyltransferase
LARLRIVAAVCIALVAVAAFTPGFTTIPPIDRDESRFSQATRQMVATGDYVEIRFQNDARYQKPIGIYWLQSAAVHLYGAEDGQAPIWVYRTVSFVGAVAAARACLLVGTRVRRATCGLCRRSLGRADGLARR